MNGTGTKVSHSDDRVVYVLKRCSHCGKRKPLEAFSPDVRRPYKVAPVCKDCCNAGVRKSRKTPEGRQKRREEQAKRRLNPVSKEIDRKIAIKGRRRVQQVDLDGTIVKEWESVSAAKKDLGFEVNNALKRKYLASDGYYYQYADS